MTAHLWRMDINGNAVEIDMAAARNIHKDNLRAERVAKEDIVHESIRAGSGASAIAKSRRCVISQMMHESPMQRTQTHKALDKQLIRRVRE